MTDVEWYAEPRLKELDGVEVWWEKQPKAFMVLDLQFPCMVYSGEGWEEAPRQHRLVVKYGSTPVAEPILREGLEAYRAKYGWRERDFPVTYSNFLRMLSLPLHPGLRAEDVDRIVGAVRDVMAVEMLEHA